MLKDTLIKIDLKRNHSRNRYKNMGYSVLEDIIYVNVNDLPKNSKEKVSVICDYCGKEYTTTYQIYNMIISKPNPKCACSDCVNTKKEETNMVKFSTKYASQNPKIKLKTIFICNCPCYGRYECNGSRGSETSVITAG